MTGKNHRTVHGPWVPDLGDGTYKNPVLYADYSDPDVIRVGEDFFLVASSFSSVPGLPVLHSKDLVNWEIINYVVQRLPFPDYDRPAHGRGIWAPSIRYHAGKFWVFVGMPDEGIFMSQTDDPFGEWSPLHMVKKAKGWIDPCPFWDDDGQAYLVHAFAASRIGFKHLLNVCRMRPDGTGLLDEGKIVFDGSKHHPTTEGPKLYKRNGYYYIFAPAGGVATGWQLILRSKNIYGPYEEKVVLHQGDTEINGPHQGGWVELASGESWFMHFQDQDAYGRVVHLQPVTWVDDWPLMGEDRNGDGIGEPVVRWKKPAVGQEYPVKVPATSDRFTGGRPGLQWQWQANPQPEWLGVPAGGSGLRLAAVPLPAGGNGTLWEVPNLLLQKFPAPAFTATTELVFHPECSGDQAGLVVMGGVYGALAIARTETGLKLRCYQGECPKDAETATEELAAEQPWDLERLFLRVTVREGAGCQFSVSRDGQKFEPFGQPFRARKGKWVGAKVGLYAFHHGETRSKGYADFQWFAVE